MKVSGPVAAGAIALAVVVLVIAGWFYARHVTGQDSVDQLHADMAKIPPGRAPFSPEQLEKMKQMRGTQPHAAPTR